MFGTMGISELIIILAIVLIIFGAGRLPQIGEGVGKALKGFKKEVNEVPPPVAMQQETAPPQSAPTQAAAPSPAQPAAAATGTPPKPNIPYVPGPEMTPGTTASLLYNMGPQGPQTAPRTAPSSPAATQTSAPAGAQQVVSMEERAAAPAPVSRAQYPPLPPGAQAKPVAKRPSAIVNKDAVARVQAQQAALKAKAAQAPGGGISPNDMQSLGEGVGDMLRTFRQAVADVRNSVDPQMRTIQAEMDAAQKEIEQSIEAAKEMPAVQEEPPKPA
jgi:TatA/E family protein of Tat protein translocase